MPKDPEREKQIERIAAAARKSMMVRDGKKVDQKRFSEMAQKNAERKESRRAKGYPTITKTYTVRVAKGSGLYGGIEKAAKTIGTLPGTYLRMALIEKLQKDGFLKGVPEDDEKPVD